MEDLSSRFVDMAESLRLRVESGWYVTKQKWNLRNRTACHPRGQRPDVRSATEEEDRANSLKLPFPLSLAEKGKPTRS